MYLAGEAELNRRARSGAVDAPGILAVVKANAYGHGAVPVARALREAGAAWLAVADIEEGIELRESGDCGRILVFGALSVSELEGIFTHDLTPTVSSPGAAQALGAAARARHVTLTCHLKIDTGLNRLGFRHDNLARTLPPLLADGALELEAVYTHFATADDPEHALFETQRERFAAARAAMAAMGATPRVVHAANSAACLRDSRTWGDLVRPGLLLYGLVPPPLAATLPLTPAMTLTSRVVAVKGARPARASATAPATPRPRPRHWRSCRPGTPMGSTAGSTAAARRWSAAAALRSSVPSAWTCSRWTSPASTASPRATRWSSSARRATSRGSGSTPGRWRRGSAPSPTRCCAGSAPGWPGAMRREAGAIDVSRQARYRFGDYVLSPPVRTLWRGGRPVPLIPRYFDLLRLLVERRGEAVAKADIFTVVWGDVIVSDGALAQAVRTLRRALDDDPRDPRVHPYRVTPRLPVRRHGGRRRAGLVGADGSRGGKRQGCGDAAVPGRWPRPGGRRLDCRGRPW